MDYIIGQNRPSNRSQPQNASTRGQERQDPAHAPAGALPGGQMAQEPARSDSVHGGDWVSDGDQRNFMQLVVETSRSVPVLVDFWATWCGPCKTLTPALERIVNAADGRVRLVKVDIDQNRALVQQLTSLGLPLQSVPTVAAFWQGQIADLFQGAQPESEIKRFVESLLKLAGAAMPSAELIAEGRAALERGQGEAAADAFSAVLQDEPDNPEAWGGLVRALVALGDDGQAEDALQQVPPAIAGHAEIAGARSALALAIEGRQAAAHVAEFEERVAADPVDHQARFDLASALNGAGRRAEAAEQLLLIVRAERSWNDEAARRQLLKLFEAWGFDDAATMTARRKLSALLFS